ncbi:CcmD family protein [Chloroflexota bacterium]
MQNLGFLLAAFIAIWVVVFAYLLYLLNRQRHLRRDIDTYLREGNTKE